MAVKESSLVAESTDREIVISRTFDAPRELVWEAWTNPKHVAQWWGPKGFTTTIEKMDVRPGGVWKHVMHGPDGTDYPNESHFVEVVRPERIVYEHRGGKKGGTEVQFQSTWTFVEQAGKTTLTIRMVFPTAAGREFVVKEHGAIEGGKQTLGRLAEYLPTMESEKMEEVTFTRVFDAPRELVFNVWTDPKHLAQWWGPKCFTNPRCEVDARAGGEMRIDMRAPDGTIYPMIGTYTEFDPPNRLAFTSGALGKDGNPMFEVLTSVTFAEQGKKTVLTLHACVTKKTPAAAPHIAGMREGWTQSLERLTSHVQAAVGEKN